MKMRNGCVVALAASVILTSTSALGAQMWKREPDLNIARSGHATVATQGKIFAFFGWDGSSYQTSFESFDGRAWTAHRGFPGPGRSAARAVEMDGYIYVLGGHSPGVSYDDVWRYSPCDDTWKSCAAMPNNVMVFGCVAMNGKIYVLCGRSWPGWTYHNTVYIYDPTFDYPGSTVSPWSTGPSHPGRQNGFPLGDNSAIGSNGKIYLFGGMTGTSGFSNSESEIWQFDPDGTTTATAWTLLPNALPQPATGMHVLRFRGQLLAMGGSGAWTGSLLPALVDGLFYSEDAATLGRTISLPLSPGGAAPPGSYGAPPMSVCMSSLF